MSDSAEEGKRTLTVSAAADKPGCVYQVGETAFLTVSAAFADGNEAHEGVLHIRLDNFGECIFEERNVDLARENPIRLAVTRATPGFMRVSVSSATTGIEILENQGNPAGTFVFGVAFSPEKIRPATSCPEDFAHFWKDAIFARPCGVTGYFQAGIHRSREDYFYYAALLGINRAVNWLAQRPKCDLSAFCYSGTSQGGGIGIMLAALNRHITSGAVFVPAITDLLGFKVEGRQSGWPELVENQLPENKAAAERWAPYFDGANFARLITCPMRFVVGFCDAVCPPHSVYSAYNVCPSPDKAIVHGIGMGHNVFDRLYRELDDWQRGA